MKPTANALAVRFRSDISRIIEDTADMDYRRQRIEGRTVMVVLWLASRDQPTGYRSAASLHSK